MNPIGGGPLYEEAIKQAIDPGIPVFGHADSIEGQTCLIGFDHGQGGRLLGEDAARWFTEEYAGDKSTFSWTALNFHLGGPSPTARMVQFEKALVAATEVEKSRTAEAVSEEQGLNAAETFLRVDPRAGHDHRSERWRSARGAPDIPRSDCGDQARPGGDLPERHPHEPHIDGNDHDGARDRPRENRRASVEIHRRHFFPCAIPGLTGPLGQVCWLAEWPWSRLGRRDDPGCNSSAPFCAGIFSRPIPYGHGFDVRHQPRLRHLVPVESDWAALFTLRICCLLGNQPRKGGPRPAVDQRLATGLPPRTLSRASKYSHTASTNVPCDQVSGAAPTGSPVSQSICSAMTPLGRA